MRDDLKKPYWDWPDRDSQIEKEDNNDSALELMLAIQGIASILNCSKVDLDQEIDKFGYVFDFRTPDKITDQKELSINRLQLANWLWFTYLSTNQARYKSYTFEIQDIEDSGIFKRLRLVTSNDGHRIHEFDSSPYAKIDQPRLYVQGKIGYNFLEAVLKERPLGLPLVLPLVGNYPYLTYCELFSIPEQSENMNPLNALTHLIVVLDADRDNKVQISSIHNLGV